MKEFIKCCLICVLHIRNDLIQWIVSNAQFQFISTVPSDTSSSHYRYIANLNKVLPLNVGTFEEVK